RAQARGRVVDHRALSRPSAPRPLFTGLHEGDDAGGNEAYNHYVKDGWHVVPWSVMFRDLDAIGHVNNAVYFTYFECGRTRSWSVRQPCAHPLHTRLIVAHSECAFRAQLVMEPIEIATRIGEMRNSSVDFPTEIRKADGTLAATGKVVVVLYDWATHSKTTI